jgi:hypothetical protein
MAQGCRTGPLVYAACGPVRQRNEGTLKTPIPKCRLYWSFLFGVVKQFCRFQSLLSYIAVISAT